MYVRRLYTTTTIAGILPISIPSFGLNLHPYFFSNEAGSYLFSPERRLCYLSQRPVLQLRSGRAVFSDTKDLHFLCYHPMRINSTGFASQQKKVDSSSFMTQLLILGHRAKLSPGAIVGVVLGIGLILSLLVLFGVRRRRRRYNQILDAVNHGSK
ncbi:hypothetical protein DFH08DRAFT_311754 [Mycena albidolilacea]|uniref:Uncharacterized protein n=1 Tax=Mycena albidolilacea TaxID=1033008 RepID=A0AAD7EIZ2_9AGAR|nr:hypothetical protein DFH08DRAFT_311754 [Mycena albidolilacea]